MRQRVNSKHGALFGLPHDNEGERAACCRDSATDAMFVFYDGSQKDMLRDLATELQISGLDDDASRVHSAPTDELTSHINSS